MQRQEANTFFLGAMCLIMVMTVLKLGQELFAPMLAAIVLGVVCAPFTDRVERMGLPRVAAALLVLGLFLTVALAAFFIVEPAVSSAIRNGPALWRELTDMLGGLRGTLAGVEELSESVAEALSDGAPAPAPAGETVEFPGVMDALALAPYLAAALLIFVGTLYFFLVARSDVYDRIDRWSISLDRDALCRAEALVSRYFLTITLINAVFGSLVGVGLTLAGMPGAMVWGLVAFLANYILYLGPAVFAVALLVGGLIQFDGAMQFVPAAAFVAMNVIEGQFVTPSLVGRHMEVNPLLVFVSLTFWLWLWGPIGGLVAIPTLVWMLHVVDHLRNGPRRTVQIDPSGVVTVA